MRRTTADIAWEAAELEINLRILQGQIERKTSPSHALRVTWQKVTEKFEEVKRLAGHYLPPELDDLGALTERGKDEVRARAIHPRLDDELSAIRIAYGKLEQDYGRFTHARNQPSSTLTGQ